MDVIFKIGDSDTGAEILDLTGRVSREPAPKKTYSQNGVVLHTTLDGESKTQFFHMKPTYTFKLISLTMDELNILTDTLLASGGTCKVEFGKPGFGLEIPIVTVLTIEDGSYEKHATTKHTTGVEQLIDLMIKVIPLSTLTPNI